LPIKATPINFTKTMKTFFSNTLTQLLQIDYPIIQAGMIWASGWELASAVSNAGGLGTIGSGSMYPNELQENIQKCKATTNKPFAVNVPLLYPDLQKHIDIIIAEKVPVVITSAGNPKLYTKLLKDNGITVIHVVSSSKFAIKCQEAGCDAIVAEGFEAGGHNGREETTTLCLIPNVAANVTIPIIAAGGIYNAKTMLATMVLGASGVQIGSRFVATPEATSHTQFKEAVVQANEGDTALTLKTLTPVRLLKNKFYNDVQQAISNCQTKEQLTELLGRARAKRGMYQGDMEEGELEIGQVSALINDIKPAATIVREIWEEFEILLKKPI
jgi:enoyl-[acyl-carrier protein] reductase II